MEVAPNSLLWMDFGGNLAGRIESIKQISLTIWFALLVVQLST